MKNIISLLLIAAASLACTKKEETKKEEFDVSANGTQITLTALQKKNAGIEVGNIYNQNIANKIMLNGQIDVPPSAIADVSSQSGGIVKVSRFLPGNYVSRGQTLAVLENPELSQLQQDYLQAKSNLGYAQKDFERQKYLNKYQASSDKVMQKAQNEAQNQNASVKAMQSRLSSLGVNPGAVSSDNIRRTVAVTSPISGYISNVNVNIGQYVSPAQILFQVVNSSKTHLALKVFEKDLAKISVGQRVFAYTNQNPEKKYQAQIALIGKDFAPDRSVPVHCELIDNSPALIPGTYMNAEIETSSQVGNTIPDTAIVTWENRQYIFEEVKPNTYKMFPVTLGNSENGNTEIVNITKSLGAKKFVTKGAYQLLMALKNVEE